MSLFSFIFKSKKIEELIKTLGLKSAGKNKYVLPRPFGFKGKAVIRWERGWTWIAAVSASPLGTMRTEDFFEELEKNPIFDMYKYKPELHILAQSGVDKEGDILPLARGKGYTFYGIAIGTKEVYDKDRLERLIRHAIELTNYFSKEG